MQTPNDIEQRESLSIEKGHELITTANTHEMEGKFAGACQITGKEFEVKGAELDAQIASTVSPTVELVEEKATMQATELDAQHAISTVPELDSNDESKRTEEVLPPGLQTVARKTAAATKVGSSWEHYEPSELDGEAVQSPVSELSAPSPATALPNMMSTSKHILYRMFLSLLV